jgi:hypothetical protein
MTDSTTPEHQAMESVADVVRDAAHAVRDRSRSGVQHVTAVQSAVTGAGLVRSVSRATYTGAYALAFGIVYPAVFVTQFLPQNNPVTDGFSDGARAAVDAVKGI